METSEHEFRLLGDLSVTIEGERRPITAGRQRAALAILLLAANRSVNSTDLIDGIWGSALPQHPDTALQIVISRLRATLGPAAVHVVSGPSGYRVEVPPAAVDLSIAQAAYSDGRRLLGENDPGRAADVLERALAQWTSDPLSDLGAFPFCEAARNRLRELRASICELRNEALLEAGRHGEVLDTIEHWVDAEPWRERLRAQHVLALYRSGRLADALRAYDAYRNRLVEELGVEPSGELRELHRDVLCHAPTLAIGAGAVGSRIPLWTSLSLPFVGRAEEQEAILARVREVLGGSRMMILVEGEAGIGKTRLILEVARRVQDDVTVLSATANDTMQPAVVGLAHTLVAGVLPLPDDELRRCLGRHPADLAAAVPELRERFPDLEPDDDAGRGFRLVSAVASCLTALSRRAPIVLLLDDVHRAGNSLMQLLGRLMVVDEQQRILVLATAKSPSLASASNLADLAQQLERRGRLDRMCLEGLMVESVERLLSRLGIVASAEEVALLHRVTDGQPFFLAEILQTDDWQRALSDPPASVREFVRGRVHTLGDAEEGILLDAAGLWVAFDAPLLAEITGMPQATTAALIDRAVAAALLRTARKGTFTFVHELCRRALLDQLDDERRALLHRRIAVALEQRDTPAAVLAMHWRLVPGPDAEARAQRYARAAGDAAIVDLDNDATAAWYEITMAASEV